MSQDEITFWDRSITPDGSNLPAGGGSVKEGEAVYLAKCAACHGTDGRGQHPMVALARLVDAADESAPGVAALWKQYREAVAELRGLHGGDDGDALADLMREFDAQVGDPPQG